MLSRLKRAIQWKRLDRRLRNRSQYARVVLVPASNDGLTWSCHVCGTVRPDDRIDVHQRRHMWPGGVIVTENIRYCNDKRECRIGAGQVFFVNRKTDEPRLESELLS